MIDLSHPEWNTRPARKLEGLVIKARSIGLEKESREMLAKMLKSQEQIELYLANSPTVRLVREANPVVPTPDQE